MNLDAETLHRGHLLGLARLLVREERHVMVPSEQAQKLIHANAESPDGRIRERRTHKE
jgi:hypothetical protein